MEFEAISRNKSPWHKVEPHIINCYRTVVQTSTLIPRAVQKLWGSAGLF